MRLIQDLRLQVHPGRATCELGRQGRRTPMPMEGTTLEAAVECKQRYLVFLGTGELYEELLHIHLLDAQLAPLDHVMVGPCDAAQMSQLQLLGPEQLSFCFPEDTPWRLTLWDAPRLRWSLLSYPMGVWRSFGQRHHFAVERMAHPRH